MNKNHTPQTIPSTNTIAAIVIAFNPDRGLPDRMESLSEQVAKIIVIDNGSDIETRSILEKLIPHEAIITHLNPKNKGVAYALNQGLAFAHNLGFQWAILLDQDSRLDPQMVIELCKSWKSQTQREKIAIVSPHIIDIRANRSVRYLCHKWGLFYERVNCHTEDLSNVSAVITTGSLVNLPIAEHLGGFRNDFFIDYVDTDYCLRALLQEYNIIVSCKAILHHSFGERKSVKFGPFTLYPSFHPPERWYTLGRNRVAMIKIYGCTFPHWFIYECVASTYTLFRMLLAEDQKIAKLAALLRGTWDGLWNRMGPPYWAK